MNCWKVIWFITGYLPFFIIRLVRHHSSFSSFCIFSRSSLYSLVNPFQFPFNSIWFSFSTLQHACMQTNKRTRHWIDTQRNLYFHSKAFNWISDNVHNRQIDVKYHYFACYRLIIFTSFDFKREKKSGVLWISLTYRFTCIQLGTVLFCSVDKEMNEKKKYPFSIEQNKSS